MVKIAVLASFNMDLVMRVERRPEAGETLQGEFAQHLGGKGFNQAVAARRLGAEVVVCGRVGDDEYGRRFLAALDDEGIDRRAVVIDPEAGTGVATIYVEPDGTNTIVQSPRANRNVRSEDFAWSADVATANVRESPEALARSKEIADIVKGVKVLLTANETNHGAEVTLRELVDHTLPVRGVGKIYAVFNPSPPQDVPEWLLRGWDLVVLNQHEAQHFAHTDSSEAALQYLTTELDFGLVVMTMGAGGARVDDDEIPAFEVPVADTTGAGDAFCAALAVRLAEGAELPDAMRYANAAGAVACTKHGAYPSMPYRREVEALMREQGSGR